MPPLSDRITAALGTPVTGLHEAGGQHGYRHVTGTLADGRSIFAKVAPGPDEAVASPGPDEAVAAAFAAEANGLRWLAEADDGPPVPAVIGVSPDLLVIVLVAVRERTRTPAQAARQFGADLARLHSAGAPSFGAPWPGYIASLPLDNTQADGAADWGSWYTRCRLLPYLRRARDKGALSRAEAGLVESVIDQIGELAGPPEPPSRLHGDLWWGNVVWSGGRGWLIDPAAHGGHRETDLAMLALFGAPHLDDILAAYGTARPLLAGWRERVPLHQLHPLAVHAAGHGPSYGAALAEAARATLVL